jgi:curved DNA-binding protein CbpA
MRFILIFLLFLIHPIRAWEQLDYDIFDLVDDVKREYGENATFYSVLGLEKSATLTDIIKAHRKLSLSLHPDKNPTEEAKRKYVILTSITDILKDSEKRERYEFFLKNGVPVWRGTGYYYKRHRPGIGTVMIMLTISSSIIHYLLMYVDWWRGKSRWESAQLELRKRSKKQIIYVIQGYPVTTEGDWPKPKPKITHIFTLAIPLWILGQLFYRPKQEKEEPIIEKPSQPPKRTRRHRI